MQSMGSGRLEKWHAYHIWCADYAQPHHQKCVCVCSHREWVLKINSEPPSGRKARTHAVIVSSFEANFLKHESFLTVMPFRYHDDRVVVSISKPENCFGIISPSLRAKIIEAINNNPSLTEEQRRFMIEDVPI